MSGNDNYQRLGDDEPKSELGTRRESIWTTSDTAALMSTELGDLRSRTSSIFVDENKNLKPYTQYDLNKKYQRAPTLTFTEQVKAEIREAWEEFDWKETARGRFPFLEAIKGYDRQKALRDLLAGVTVSVVLIPQSLAYTVLAGMPASYGLFASFTPPLIYTFFGTSREMSIGPFALISLVLSQVVPGLIPGFEKLDHTHQEEAAAEVIMGLTVMVGVIMMIMGLLRLGWIISMFSKPALSGFIIASAYVITTTQIGTVLQLKVPHDATFQEAWKLIFTHLPDINWCSFIVGTLGIIILLVLEHLTKPPRFKIPLPFPIGLVFLTTIISYLASFEDKFEVSSLWFTSITFVLSLIFASIVLLLSSFLLFYLFLFFLTLSLAIIVQSCW